MSGQAVYARRERPRLAPTAAHEQVRVVIADHDELARSRLRAALDSVGEITTIATAGDGREAIEFARYYKPALLIVDTALLSGGRAGLIGKILVASPETRVLTIAVDDDKAALAALRGGAVGHLSKCIDSLELGRLVVRAAAGEAVVTPSLTAALLECFREVPESGWRPLHSRLTTREWQIVGLLEDGASTRDIAERLVLAQTTVYCHVKSLLRKLGVHSRHDAVVAARLLRRREALGEMLDSGDLEPI